MNISAQQKRKTEESWITTRIPPESTGTVQDTVERPVRLYRWKRSYLARASRSEKEKGEEKRYVFQKMEREEEKGQGNYEQT